MKRLLLTLVALCLVIQFAAAAIEETVLVDLVDLYFTATDHKGRFITDLKKEELTIREDGVAQKIERFGTFEGERNEIPLLLSLVIDNSASMDQDLDEVRKLDLARDAGLALLNELGPLDRVTLVRFSDTVTVTGLTSDKEVIATALRNMRPRWWQTALFDALESTIKTLNSQAGRKILLVCSDGQDNMSQTTLDHVLEVASQTPELTIIVLGTVKNAPVYGIHGRVQSMPALPMFRGKEILETLAQKTAGYAFFPKNLKDAQKLFELLRSFVRSQYYLAYRSTNTKLDGSWRKMELTCKRKDVKLHYRSGYFAK
jgi:Ca-activated chloride channel homolog